ncbi:TIGR04222 domain-containing membrane protein [uncultured Microscilla sp.]|uniref:TIGR04222 domain-containing membrane protein n=1 Tax=uncultured Microscilla sp. TaxID=432653 RepID=UPI0026181FED|nr:TIGR04222 domain-containing membrane protein [uncultured Microscilla sp.]
MTNIILTLDNNILSISFYKFIALYILAILAMLSLLIIVSKKIKENYYKKATQQQIKISSPLQIAYLNNGLPGYIRTVLFQLIQEGYLTKPKRHWFSYKVKATATHPPVKDLSKAEQTIFHYAASNESWHKIINHQELHEDLWKTEATLETQLTNFNLLYPQPVLNRLNKLRGIFILFTLTLGSYRYLLGTEKARTGIWSLLLVGMLGMMLITHVAKLDRVTKQGQKYLSSLKNSYKDLNPAKSNKYKLVVTSLLKDDKQEMASLLKMLKNKKPNQHSWAQMPQKYLNNLSANPQLET